MYIANCVDYFSPRCQKNEELTHVEYKTGFLQVLELAHEHTKQIVCRAVIEKFFSEEDTGAEYLTAEQNREQH